MLPVTSTLDKCFAKYILQNYGPINLVRKHDNVFLVGSVLDLTLLSLGPDSPHHPRSFVMPRLAPRPVLTIEGTAYWMEGGRRSDMPVCFLSLSASPSNASAPSTWCQQVVQLSFAFPIILHLSLNALSPACSQSSGGEVFLTCTKSVFLSVPFLSFYPSNTCVTSFLYEILFATQLL